jgi:DNA-binding NtrC family response regulator
MSAAIQHTHSPRHAPRAAAARAHKPTLLFVDDEERILRSLRMMFAQQYQVRTTTSGVEALDILRNERIHALVSDQRMPIMAGVDLLRHARDISPNTMRMLLTGYSDLEAVTGSINEGEIFRYISKPWNPDEIRVTIDKAVDIALELEAPVFPGVADTQPATPDTMLVIDEDPDVAAQIKALVDEKMPQRVQIEWAGDVESVFRIMEKREIAVVITEVRLHGEDLTDLIKSLKQHQPHTISLALTRYQDSATLVGLINQAQIHRFLLKPIRAQLAWRGIESGLQRHHALKNAPKLSARHQVEKAALDTPAAKRILGFFRGLKKNPVH